MKENNIFQNLHRCVQSRLREKSVGQKVCRINKHFISLTETHYSRLRGYYLLSYLTLTYYIAEALNLFIKHHTMFI